MKFKKYLKIIVGVWLCGNIAPIVLWMVNREPFPGEIQPTGIYSYHPYILGWIFELIMLLMAGMVWAGIKLINSGANE